MSSYLLIGLLVQSQREYFISSGMKIILIIFSVLLAACSSTQPTASNSATAPVSSANTITPNNPSLSLADYLKRVPGVQVLQSGGGTIILVRGNNTLEGQREPLFIVNGVNVGFGYENAEPLVAVSDIESVRVLKSGQETASFGMQGSNGVIIIKTKQ